MKNNREPLKIGLKYCGGCKPNYDRVALVDHIKARLKGIAQIVPPDSEGIAFILAVHGCQTACADLAPFDSLQVFSVTGPEAGERFVAYVESVLQAD